MFVRTRAHARVCVCVCVCVCFAEIKKALEQVFYISLFLCLTQQITHISAIEIKKIAHFMQIIRID